MKTLLFASAVMAGDLPCDFSFNIVTDPSDSNRFKIEASVPENMYLGIAYGSGMNQVDLVRFVGADDGTIEDLWGTGYWTPTTDDQQDYVGTTVELEDGIYNFVTYRDLITTDSDQDFQFNSCDQSLSFKWVANTNKAAMSKHTDSGEFTLDVASDCTISMTELPTCSSEDGESSAATIVGPSILLLGYLMV